MKDLILIKFGGSVITDKNTPEKVKYKNIKSLVSEVSEAREKLKNSLLILATGGGSASHPPAAKYALQNGLKRKDSPAGLSITADAEIRMNRIVVSELIKKGVPVMSFSPASFILTKNHRVSRVFVDPIKNALKFGIVPVVYGDMLIDETLGCTVFSTESVFETIIKEFSGNFKKISFINCGRTDGVYDSKGRTIHVITQKNAAQVQKFISGSAGIDVTGGMLHKVEICLRLAKNYKVVSLIINGEKKGQLSNSIFNKKIEGTIVK